MVLRQLTGATSPIYHTLEHPGIRRRLRGARFCPHLIRTTVGDEADLHNTFGNWAVATWESAEAVARNRLSAYDTPVQEVEAICGILTAT